MGLIETIRNRPVPHPEDTMTVLSTVWGEALDPVKVLPEYPRPRFVRGSHINLNGVWRYAITKTSQAPAIPDGTILVPFSPESKLSGVMRSLMPEEYLWYFKTLPALQAPSRDARLLLHFGAIDQVAEVYVNGHYQCTHVGGYLPFTVDITDALLKEQDLRLGKANQLVVRVQDTTGSGYHTRGKQSIERGGIFYTAQSGIWQSVWMEWVPACYIKTLQITPHADLQSVSIYIETSQPAGVEVVLYDDNNKPFTKAYCSTNPAPQEEDPLNLCRSGSDTKPCNLMGDGRFVSTVRLLIEHARCWTPKDPYLYRMSLRVGTDTVVTYFGMRHVEVKEDEAGVPRFYLNHQPLFLNGVLDQGYWPDGLMTAPSDQALVHDIAYMKRLGFNMMRKHAKVETARWYYHCDRLGMLVFQDMVNGGSPGNKLLTETLPHLFPGLFRRGKDDASRYSLLGRSHEEGRRQWEGEMKGTIEHLYNAPCICGWGLFREGRGQFDAERFTFLAKSIDDTRPVDQASGWFDRGGGDFYSVSTNHRKGISEGEQKGRATLLWNAGGLALRLEEHAATPRCYGQKQFSSIAQLNEAWRDLMVNQLKAMRDKGLSGVIYTQVSDIEDECNGLMTYDRKVMKIEPFSEKRLDAVP